MDRRSKYGTLRKPISIRVPLGNSFPAPPDTGMQKPESEPEKDLDSLYPARPTQDPGHNAGFWIQLWTLLITKASMEPDKVERK
jgi:hypothetical protein